MRRARLHKHRRCCRVHAKARTGAKGSGCGSGWDGASSGQTGLCVDATGGAQDGVGCHSCDRKLIHITLALNASNDQKIHQISNSINLFFWTLQQAFFQTRN